MPEQPSASRPKDRREDTLSAPLSHRPEIDGLRSLAILPILLLHTGVTQLAGGYIGVDIFFVISGYLITAIVMRELGAGTFSLAGFYRRRIVRILPALLAMVAVVLALGCAILFPVELRRLGHSIAATAVFGSNIYFYQTIDYFVADTNPMVHTWSLAVEEQFYLLYPLLLMAMRGFDRRRVVSVMIGLAAVSFVIGAYLAFIDPSAAFYLLPARAWELLLGGLVAMGVYPRIDRAPLRGAVCWTALAAILVAIVVVRPSSHFPVPLALPPAGGAALLIAYAPGTRVSALLSWRPLRWIGLISYSLYLWHRPIIAYYLLGRSVEMQFTDTVILLLLSFGAAILSYWLVEKPALRRWRSGAGFIPHAVAAAGLLAIAGTGLVVANRAERFRTLPPNVAQVVSYIGFEKTAAGIAQYAAGRCFALPHEKPNDPECLVPAADRTNVLLLGDSYAAQLSQALRRDVAPAHLMQATAAGCRPLLDMPGLESCRRLILQALHETDFSKVSGVVLAGRWMETDVQPVADVVRFLRSRGVRSVVVVGPVVEYDAEVPDALGRAMLAGDPSRISTLRRTDRADLDRRLAPIAVAAGAAYVSHFALECPHGQCRLFTPDGGPIHADHAHLAPEATVPIAQAIVEALAVSAP